MACRGVPPRRQKFPLLVEAPFPSPHWNIWNKSHYPPLPVLPVIITSGGKSHHDSHDMRCSWWKIEEISSRQCSLKNKICSSVARGVLDAFPSSQPNVHILRALQELAAIFSRLGDSQNMVNPLLAPLQASTLTFPNSQNVKSHDHHLTKYVSFPHFQKKYICHLRKISNFFAKIYWGHSCCMPVSCLFFVSTKRPLRLPWHQASAPLAKHHTAPGRLRRGASSWRSERDADGWGEAALPWEGLGNVHWWGGILEV